MDKELRPDDPRVIELAKHDEVIQWMLAKHIPITREAYIEFEPYLRRASEALDVAP